MIEKLIYQSRTTEVDAVSDRMIGLIRKAIWTAMPIS